MSQAKGNKARWMRDLARFLPLKSQFVLYGNVRDLQVVESENGFVHPLPLSMALESQLKQFGYQNIIFFNHVDGFSVNTFTKEEVDEANALLKSIKLTPSGACASGGMDLLRDTLPNIVNFEGEPIVILIDLASRLIVRNSSLSQPEHDLFTHSYLLSQQAQAKPYGSDAKPFFNTIIWIADREGDLPDWFLIANPALRSIPIGMPDHIMRRSVAKSFLKGMPGARNADAQMLSEAESEFVDETEGMLLTDLKAITQLGRQEGVVVEKIGEAVRRYKVGVTEDPWQNIDRKKIQNAEQFIKQRVKGQAHAVTHMLDIIKRAITGVGSSKRGGRPRGVAFLAGPTGVGKTELAKTITSLLFGDDSAYIRFDMSEFSAEHSDQRLIGAPPGYIGYDEGGELTNAIREKPFSVVLFDEIEKAHPRILDKFLQILDDGVLTSGRGERVYFSEALIIFTSNLGIYKINSAGERVQNVLYKDDFEDVQRKVLSEIGDYFKFVLNRPEILNRLGDNLIVFDFIRPDVAEQIFSNMVKSTLVNVNDQGIHVELAVEAEVALKNVCLKDLTNGGRGIRNKIETYLVNPLARALFDSGATTGSRWVLSSIEYDDVVEVKLQVSG